MPAFVAGVRVLLKDYDTACQVYHMFISHAKFVTCFTPISQLHLRKPLQMLVMVIVMLVHGDSNCVDDGGDDAGIDR
jgi:hypothetical protein